MLEIIGWVGATCFSMCALPQVVKTYKTKSVGDFSWLFLLMWWVGEVLTFGYVFKKNLDCGSYQYPLLFNYVLNFVMVCYLVYAKVKYKE